MQYGIIKETLGLWLSKCARQSCFYLQVPFFIVKGVFVTFNRWMVYFLSVIGLLFILIMIDASKHEYTQEMVLTIWNGAKSGAFFNMVVGLVISVDFGLSMIVGSHPLVTMMKHIYEFYRQAHGHKGGEYNV